jgi:hypothetical protein
MVWREVPLWKMMGAPPPLAPPWWLILLFPVTLPPFIMDIHYRTIDRTIESIKQVRNEKGPQRKKGDFLSHFNMGDTHLSWPAPK